MSQVLSPWGYLPDGWRLSTIKEEMVEVTDYVANGSFATLRENVTYKDAEDYAVLIRTADYHNNFEGNFVYIDEKAYNFLSKSKLFGGEIIIANVGSVGEVFKCPILSKKMSLAPNAIMVKLKGNNDFFYYWFKSRIGQHNILNLVSGSAQPKFNKTHFKAMEIPVPPINVQDKIAENLSALDDKIANNHRICKNLEAQAQALFKHWFVDFAPFKDGKFVESELGLIPEGWRVGKAEDFYTINIGKTPPRAERQWFSESKGKNKIWISISDMGCCGTFISDSKEYLTPEAQSKFNIVMVPAGTILLSFKLTIGRVAIADNELTTNEAIARFILPNSDYREFTYLYLKQYKYGSLGSTSSIATAVNSKIIKSMPFLMPSPEVMAKFSNVVGNLFDEMKILSKESSRLASLRDTLLPKLMTGEINVNEIDKSL